MIFKYNKMSEGYWGLSGNPPEGTKCEAAWLDSPDGGGRDFEPVMVKAYWKRQVWFCTSFGDDITCLAENVKFRPIRTPEQRERDEVISTAHALLIDIDTDRTVEATLAALYDAGMLKISSNHKGQTP